VKSVHAPRLAAGAHVARLNRTPRGVRRAVQFGTVGYAQNLAGLFTG